MTDFLSKNLVVCFDVETNGFQGLNIFSRLHRVIEIGFRWGEEEDEHLEDLVTPAKLILHPKSTKIHNIEPKMLVGCNTFIETWELFKKKSRFSKHEKVYMVAHNCFFFDKIMLEKEHIPKEDLNRIIWVDTYPLLKKLLPKHEQENFKLMTVYHKLFPNASQVNAHRVFDDVLVLWRVMKDFLLPRFGHLNISQPSKSLFNTRGIGFKTLKMLTWYDIETIDALKDHVHHDPKALDKFLFFDIEVRSRFWRYMIIYQIFECHAGWIDLAYDDVDQYLIEWDLKRKNLSLKAMRGKLTMHKCKESR